MPMPNPFCHARYQLADGNGGDGQGPAFLFALKESAPEVDKEGWRITGDTPPLALQCAPQGQGSGGGQGVW